MPPKRHQPTARTAEPRPAPPQDAAHIRLTPQPSSHGHRGWPALGTGRSAGSGGRGRRARASSASPRGELDYHADWLRKLKVGKGWKQRWVTVATGQSVLEYRKSKGDEQPKGAIQLAGCTVVRDVPESMLRGKLFEKEAPRDTRLCFRVISEERGEYVFAATTMEERERWVNLLAAKSGRRTSGPGSWTPQQVHRSGNSQDSGGLRLSLSSLPAASSLPRAASSAANRRLQIYGSLVCFRVQRVLIEWLRSDSEHAMRPAHHAVRALDFNGAELARASSRRSFGISSGGAVSARGLRHRSDIEAEQRQRAAALETEQAALETAIVDDLALQSVQSEIARLQSQSAVDRQLPKEAANVRYFAGWLEVRGLGASAGPSGFWSRGRKSWRMQWCVLAGGFLLAFEKPVDQLSATVRVDLTCFLLGYDLTVPDSNEVTLGRPECMLLSDSSESDPASRKQFVLNVPGQQLAPDVEPGLWTPTGDAKTAEDWKQALRWSIAAATKHDCLSLEHAKAAALNEVLEDNTCLLSLSIDSSTDLCSPSVAEQLGVKPHCCWTTLLCAASLSRSMCQMQATHRLQMLRAMDVWFVPHKPLSSSGASKSQRLGSGSSSGSLSSGSRGHGSAGSLSGVTAGLPGGFGVGPHGLPVELAGTLQSPRRELLRYGLLRCTRERDDNGTELGAGVGLMLRGASTGDIYAAFLFSDILLIATPHAPGTPSGQLGPLLNYHWHCPLTECYIGPSAESHQFCVRHSSFEWTFETADSNGAEHFQLHNGARQWLASCCDAREHARTVQRHECRIERYEGAVLFADLSGFSNLGDELERRHERAIGTVGGPQRLAAEELAKITDEEIEKMVAVVTKGGGDVIQFSGDCVIAVFPAADYKDEHRLLLETDASPLSLATAQASQVALQMVQSKDEFFRTQYEILDAADAAAGYGAGSDAGIQQLQDALDIHAAVGSGLVYGYHVGGGPGDKWHYVVDGPAMEQVRVADGMSQAGEVILSSEARNLIKPLAERIREHKRDAVSKDHKHVAVWELETFFGRADLQREHVWPWETLAFDQAQGQGQETESQLARLGLQWSLADKLRCYIPQPVVDQVDDGQVDHRGWLQSRRVVSTMFVKLYGIDYHADNGEQAVAELGSLVVLIQRILQDLPVGTATMTRVSCDDKGTSAIVLCDEAPSAVLAAARIVSDVSMLGEQYRATIGITTGKVWLGVAGGGTRAEYTMHGSCVNFAARLMSSPLIKETGGVLVDEATVQASLRQQGELPATQGLPCMDFEPQEPQRFKGFVEKVVAYMPAVRGLSAPSQAQLHPQAQRDSAVHGTPKSRSVAPAPAAAAGAGGLQHELTHMERQTLQVCAVLAMASAPDRVPMAPEGPDSSAQSRCCVFCADSVAALHPTLDPLACHAELARLAAVGGASSRLVALPMPPPSQETDGTLALYSFRWSSEMESLYHALTIDRLQLLHGHAIDDLERRLQDGIAHRTVGIPNAEAQVDKRCVAR